MNSQFPSDPQEWPVPPAAPRGGRAGSRAGIAARCRRTAYQHVTPVRITLLALSLVWLGGCGSGQRTAQPVKPDLARQTLTQVLQQWKSGTTPEACQTLDPPVVVQDLAWSRGDRLLDYELVSDHALDANLFVDVQLTIAPAHGSQQQLLVRYCVGTDPVLTVFRVLM